MAVLHFLYSMPVKLLKSNPFFVSIVLLLIIQSCTKSVDADYQLVDSKTSGDINKIEHFEDRIIAIGGDAWTYGMILEYEADSLRVLRETDKELMALGGYENKMIAAGMNGFLFEIGDQIRFFQHSQGQVARDLMETEQGILLVGGKSYSLGYVSSLNNKNEVERTIDFSFELRSIDRFSDGIYVSGFGAIFKSEDEGASWQKLDMDGDFFISISRTAEGLGFITGQEGLIYHTQDHGRNWKKMRAPSRQQINGAEIIQDKLFLFCNHGIYQTYDPGKDNWSIYKTGHSNLNDGHYQEGQLFLVGDDGFFAIVDI